MKKNTTLYSICFPLFLILAFPRSLYALLPLNFAIDIAVARMALKAMDRLELFKPMWKKELWLCSLFSLIGACAGGAALYGLSRISSDTETWLAVVQGITRNPFMSTNALLAVFGCIILAAALTYVLTLWLSLRKTDMTLKEKREFSLSFALLTAPYAFILPTAWFLR